MEFKIACNCKMVKLITTKDKRNYLVKRGVVIHGDARKSENVEAAMNRYKMEKALYAELLEEGARIYEGATASRVIPVRKVVDHERDLMNLDITGTPYRMFANNEELIELLKVIFDQFLGSRFVIAFSDGPDDKAFKYRTLNSMSIENMITALSSNAQDEYYSELLNDFMNGGGSYISIMKLSKSTMTNLTDENGEEIPEVQYRENRDGGFFPYLHKLTGDLVEPLSMLQIYDTFNPENYRHGCLYVALQTLGLSQNKLDVISNCVKSRNLTKSELKVIAESMEVQIVVHEYRSGGKDKQTILSKYGITTADEELIYHVALLENHYFVFDEFTTRQRLDGVEIRTSLGLVRHLFVNKEKYLIKMSNFELSSLGYKTEQVESLEYNFKKMEKINIDYQKMINEGKKLKEIKSVYYADFECFTEDSRKHKAYQLGYIYKDDPPERIRTLNVTNDEVDLTSLMLDDICSRFPTCATKPTKKDGSVGAPVHGSYNLIYFHNAKYDVCFFNFNKILDLSVIMDGSTFYGMEFKYMYKKEKHLFCVRDTLKHLDCALAKMPETFNITDKYPQKEIMPYNFYTLENIQARICSIEDAVRSLIRYRYECSEEDITQFRNNIKSCGAEKPGDMFDIIKYSTFYNRLDVLILRDSFEIWRKQALEFTEGLDIYHIFTSASLAQQYFEKKKTYENVWKLNQAPRRFIHQSVYGGRCMTSRNRKINIQDKIQDFDAVSLYPSAIMRMGDLGGLLCGSPKVLTEAQLNKEFLDSVDGYFVDIRILYLKDRAFPLIPKKTEDGGLDYETDNLIAEVITVGKIQLEDLINFCDCKYEIIRGYYFNEGRDPQACKVIENLFETRLKYKALTSPLQSVVKLIMNSMYGKTITRERECSSVILLDEEVKQKDPETGKFKKVNAFHKYIANNYNRLKGFTKIGDSNLKMVEVFNNVYDHQGMPHVGSEILAMSKRIMSEVMCLAEDNGIDIFMQDTDSMHMRHSQTDLLDKLFSEKYGRKLSGKAMGQFHCDFDSDILEKGRMWSKHFVALGKKSYVDVLTDSSGKIDYHVRMKGIPKKCLQKTIDRKSVV